MKSPARAALIGSLLLAYVVSAAFHSITEAGFRLLDPNWIFLLLSAVAADGVVLGARRRTRQRHDEPASFEEFSGCLAG